MLIDQTVQGIALSTSLYSCDSVAIPAQTQAPRTEKHVSKIRRRDVAIHQVVCYTVNLGMILFYP
jgi:hypothetical protein